MRCDWEELHVLAMLSSQGNYPAALAVNRLKQMCRGYSSSLKTCLWLSVLRPWVVPEDEKIKKNHKFPLIGKDFKQLGTAGFSKHLVKE